MKNIMMTGFAGAENSSRILVESLSCENLFKIILKNNFEECSKQILNAIDKKKPDVIFSFGQKPNSNRLYIESTAKGGRCILRTNYDITGLEDSLKSNFIKYKISENAGNYFCNHVYYAGLRSIEKNT